MELLLSILVYLGYLLLNVWYPQAYIDRQLEQHQHEIQAVMSNQEQMKQVKIYNIKHDGSGNIIIIDSNDIDE